MPRKKSSEKKEIVPVKKERPTGLVPYRPLDLWRNFDSLFDDFRKSFQNLMWPLAIPHAPSAWMMPKIESRIPYADLADRGKDYMLTAEMPGFKKEDIDIQVTGKSIEIKAVTGWKYDEKTKTYICKERACESFHRRIELPEEIKANKVKANIKDGLLEIKLPKKAPKPKEEATKVTVE